MQTFLENDIVRYKDVDLMDDEKLLTSEVKRLGIEFMSFIESFYDLDSNYTEDGFSDLGFKYLSRYKDKYKYDICQ